MSAGHTCFRSVLAQAFRPSSAAAAASASCTVPAYLVPACARRPGRPFSSSGRCGAEPVQPASEHRDARSVRQNQPKPYRPYLRSVIPLPRPDARADVEQWLLAIDRFLPPHFRRSPSSEPDISASVTPADVAWFVLAAQQYAHDILCHVGLVEQRWDTVIWMAKRLVKDGKQSLHAPMQLEPFANVVWPERQPPSLNDLTNSALKTERARPTRKLTHSLDELTSIPESINPRHRLIKRALGQLWRTVGKMILVATDDNQPDHAMIMHRVLEIIAYLHHMGLIPESVYAHKPTPNNHALQQPPTLHVLSMQILTALSDAQWRAHEASVKAATQRLNASYFLGHEIPGSRYKVRVTEVAPELWLELVLWSCLHGGWILDGSAILEQVASHRGGEPWGLTSWKELLQTEEEQGAADRNWSLFRPREAAVPDDALRARTQRKISSEVVTAFVDGLVNDVRLGVGSMGTTPEYLVGRIKVLKQMLDTNSLSLGSTTWNSVMSRLVESGSIVPERRPELLLSVLDLASGFGTEVSAVNASSKLTVADSEPPYFFEPSTVPLSLLHWTLRSFVQNGDISGAMSTLQKLQEHTDRNKQVSLEQFFEKLKSVPLHHNEPFTNRFPPIEFPAFENQLSVPLLARLLDLVTDAKLYELGQWFLYSEDLDGPLIRPDMYGEWIMAASIIRFGTMAGEHDLVLKIVKKAGRLNNAVGTARMPHEFLTALLCSQIKLHRWNSVRGMQNHVLELPGYQLQPEILAQFGAELLRLSASTTEADLTKKTDARTAFKDMLFTLEHLVLLDLRNELYCILAILSTIDKEWREYCSQFLAFSARQGIRLSTDDFNNVLGGILDGYGSVKAREVVDMWCYKPPRTFEPYRAPGGLPAMPIFRVGKGEEYESRPANIEIHQASGAKLILLGRIHPNRQTIWAILRKAQQEREEIEGDIVSTRKRAEVGETLKWAARMLYYMGFDYEDIIRDLGSLAELAELEAPPAPRTTLRLWEDGPGL